MSDSPPTATPSPTAEHAAEAWTSPTAEAGTQRVDLVLEGGGVKGIALAGAMEVLEERGYRVNRVAGSSAGAMAGALATAGIPASTMAEVLRETDYRLFEDGPWWTRPLVGKGLSILLHNGVHRGTHLTRWLEEQLGTYGPGDRTGTFADLRYTDPDPSLEMNGAKAHRLVVTASDLSAGKLRYLPLDAEELGRAPDALRVVDAVRASASIPLFFRPVRWKRADGATSVLVDGGMLSNFPVSVFDRPTGEVPRWPTFGIKLSAAPETDFGTRTTIRGPLSFGKAVVDTVTGFYDRMHIDAAHAVARTIFIDTEAVRPTQFDLSEEDRELLYRKGREAATEFLDGEDDQDPWDFAAYTTRFRTESEQRGSAGAASDG
ncbi:patatin-like phospholipase family protein [Brachybacterium sp. AOP43-C2-M15]|uniref:patatin-like phospholipase family protein n=1 Tax=Brachybacterium sp. AOP43-C2-M15 TaxID=3457661 RepID=UPI00403336F6